MFDLLYPIIMKCSDYQLSKETIMVMKDYQILSSIMSKSLIILITSNYNED